LVQLRTQRTALALYAVLLVLPTLVLGFLQWHHIVSEKREDLLQVPYVAEDEALRFRTTMQEELDKLIAAEGQRSWDHYSPYYCPSTADGEFAMLETPLRRYPRPNELLAWFAFDLLDADRSAVQDFFGSDPPPAEAEAQLRQATVGLRGRFFEKAWMRDLTPVASGTELQLPIMKIAATVAAPEDAEALRVQQMQMPELVATVVDDFRLLFYREPDGTPRLVAHRHVWIEPKVELTGIGNPWHGLRQGRRIVQGFFLDPAWFFDALPYTVALNVLSQRARFLREGETCCEGDPETHQARVRPIADLGFESETPEDAAYQTYRIAIDTSQIDARYRERLWRFVGVASMLALALSTGVFLLGRSVQKDLEQAQRTENFVAAVTHELRTPLSAIKLHGEMLLDGWATEPAQQQEYYRRIVRETERLSTLVERVLEKAKLSSGAAPAVEGDLYDEVARHLDKL
jgi:hypothetical protein